MPEVSVTPLALTTGEELCTSGASKRLSSAFASATRQRRARPAGAQATERRRTGDQQDVAPERVDLRSRPRRRSRCRPRSARSPSRRRSSARGSSAPSGACSPRARRARRAAISIMRPSPWPAAALVGDDLPVPDPDHPARMRGDLVLMRDQHDRPPLLAEALEQRQHLGPRGRVEVPGRLVGEDQRRIGDERAGDGDALLLAARQLRGQVVDPVFEPDLAQRRQRPLVARGPRQAGVGQRQLDVRERPRARNQVVALEDEADVTVADVREVVLVDAADVESVQPVDPARRARPGSP